MKAPLDGTWLTIALQIECDRSRYLVEEIGPVMCRRVAAARQRAALVQQQVWLRRLFGTVDTFLASTLADEEVAIGAAWVMQFGPIETDAQFAAIVQTVHQARCRRA